MEEVQSPSKKKTVIGLVTLSIFVLSVLLFTLISNKQRVTFNSRADGTTTVGMEFNPSTFTGPVAQEFTTTIKATPSVRFFTQGYSFGLSFDKARLEVTDIAYKLGTVSSGLGDSNSTLATVNSNGYIKVQGDSQTSTGALLEANTQTEVVTLKFKIKAAGATSVTLGTVTSATFGKVETTGTITPIAATLTALQVNAAGTSPTVNPTSASPQPTASTAPNPTEATDLSVTMKLKFQGVNKKPNDKYSTMPVKITVVSDDGKRNEATATFTADTAGVWAGTVTFKKLEKVTGSYFLVKGPKHIQKKVCVEKPTEQYPGSYRCKGQNRITIARNGTYDFSGIYMLTGDLPNQDGLVDSYDLSLVRNNIGKTDESVVKLADVNFDGIVDSQDHSLLIAALSIAYDEE